jgi:hypothetical protein
MQLKCGTNHGGFMKFIHNGVLVELILNFDENLVLAFCSKIVNPESRLMNYSDLNSQQFSLTEYILGNGEKYSSYEIIREFSINDVILKVCEKIDQQTNEQS